MKKIQTKIITVIILAVIIISVVNITQSFVITRMSTMTALEKTLSETTKLAALSAENMISSYTLTVAEIASNPILTNETTSLQQKQEFIQEKVEAYYMRSGGIADASGYDAVHSIDVSSEAFFQASIQGESYMTSPYIDGNDTYLIVSAPILQDGVAVGIVYFQCDTLILQSITDNIKVGDEGEAYILDKNGTTIAYLDEQSILKQENTIQEAIDNPDNKDLQKVADIERKMLAGETGVESFSYAEDNSKNIQGYAPIQGTDGWSVAITVSEDEFMKSAYIGNFVQLIVSSAIGLLVIVISFFVGRSIAKPIVKCAKRLQALAEGDLNSQAPQVNSKDEVRVLADSTAHLIENFRMIVSDLGTALSSMANGDLTKDSTDAHYPGDFIVLQKNLQVINDRLNQTMSGIVQAVSQVTGGSAQMASTSAILSQGSMQQSAAVEQLSATIGEMDQDAKKTAHLATEAKEAADSAGIRLQESSQHIDNLNQAMDSITNSSSEIGRIIDTIENISFQTNILALNASVEAARAGEAGKGFAVVADEVRNLAAKSAEAAEATKELIKHSIETVDRGNGVVDKVTKSLTEVITLAEQVVDQVDIVSHAVEQQTGAIEQVTIGISQISDVVQTNSATAQESAAASQELSSQADLLENLVSGFKLK